MTGFDGKPWGLPQWRGSALAMEWSPAQPSLTPRDMVEKLTPGGR
jgi:hypothetical protein